MPFLHGSFLPLLQILGILSSFSFANAQAINFAYTYFDSDLSDFVQLKDGDIHRGALQVTWNEGSGDGENLGDGEKLIGRVMYSQPLRFWDHAYHYTASFNTSFDFNIHRPAADAAKATAGGGMAFIMAANSTDMPQNTSGQLLGLCNSSADNFTQLVAIELDTFKDSFDPDDNHVGIDLNSIVSSETASLDPSSLPLINNHTNITVWIDYDGRGKRLDVYVAKAPSVKPVATPLLSLNVSLSDYLPNSIFVGFSASTGDTSDTHSVLRWSFTTTEGLPDSTRNMGLTVGLSVAAALILLLVAVIILLVVLRQKRANRRAKKWSNFTYGPRKFAYTELNKATNNFSDDHLLGKGGFGAVYKGILASNGSLVAVKRISPKSNQGEREFIAEVTIIGRLRHKNLVQLLGWSHNHKGQLLLVYEYMPNGSLDQWIFGNQKDVNLDWGRRYNIMRGLAAALLYLHEEWEQRVVHRDVKPSNVMLDTNYNARLGDFGLARLIENNEDGAPTTTVAGTPGYMAPECLYTGEVTPESDVYSFGAVAMEVACGRRPFTRGKGYLAHWLWSLSGEGKLLEAADPRLEGQYEEEEMMMLLRVGLACSNPDPQKRPSIREVLQSLSMEAGYLPRVPSSKPMALYDPSYTTSSSRTVFTDPSTILPSFAAAR